MKKTHTVTACVHGSGVIEFIDVSPGVGLPESVLYLARGEHAVIVDAVSALARRGYDGVTLLVPGLPEATDVPSMLHAFNEFFERVQVSLGSASNIPKIRERANAKL